MRIAVDYNRCDSLGTCVEACPAVFTLNDDDELVVLIDRPSEELRDGIEAAVHGCPKNALQLIED